MRIIRGNLVTLAAHGCFDYIIHGCNCFCKMGSGVADSIRLEFPLAYVADKKTKIGDRSKLGTYTHATVTVNDDFNNGGKKKLVVINAYTQFEYGGRRDLVDYDAVSDVFEKLRTDLPTTAKIGIPKIGAGLANGDWSRIRAIIETKLAEHNVTVVEYDLSP